MNVRSIRVSAIFVWIGFVGAISFMEAWLKFTAPGVSLTTGLAIGQVVFNALNKVEICLASIVLFTTIRSLKDALTQPLLLTALAVLAVQSSVVLPMLSNRIDIYLSGSTPEPSTLHITYLFLEVIKVITLFSYGHKQLNS